MALGIWYCRVPRGGLFLMIEAILYDELPRGTRLDKANLIISLKV